MLASMFMLHPLDFIFHQAQINQAAMLGLIKPGLCALLLITLLIN